MEENFLDLTANVFKSLCCVSFDGTAANNGA